MNKKQLLSAIAFTALTITWMPVSALADTSTCAQLPAQALQQRIIAGKCDAGTHLSPEMAKALALAEKGNKGVDDYLDQPMTEPGDDAPDDAGDKPANEEAKNGGGEPSKGGSEEGGNSGSGGGKQKKLPGEEIVMKTPTGDINIGDKPVVKKTKESNGDEAIGEEIEELEFGTPAHEPAIAEEVDDLALADPEHPVKTLAEPEEPIKTLAEPDGLIKTLAEPEGLIKTLADPEDGAFQNGHGGKDHADHEGSKKDSGAKESKGPKGGNGFAG